MPLLHAFVTQCHACHAPLLHVLACYVRLTMFNIISQCFMPYVTNCYICYTLIGKHICYTVVAQLFYTQLLHLKI